MSNVRVRFAPSPTGMLHIGGARTAIYNWAFARSCGGKFILRIEDTDKVRSTDENTQIILRALKWLGLDWDEGPKKGGDFGPYYQMQRMDIYKSALDYLIKHDKAYPCFCTKQEIAQKKEEAIKEHGGYDGYDRTCRNIPKNEWEKLIKEGKPHVWRLKVPLKHRSVEFDDEVYGHMSFPSEVLDDLILVREDGVPTYNFAVVCDDSFMKITHVIRGDDHLSNTPRQILIYEALGKKIPKFAHLSMILGPDKKKLSKRHGSTSVEEYKDKGYLPDAMVNFLSLLGWSLDGSTTIIDRHKLCSSFSLDRINKKDCIFDVTKLDWMNGCYIREYGVKWLLENAREWFAKAYLLSIDQKNKGQTIIPTLSKEEQKNNKLKLWEKNEINWALQEVESNFDIFVNICPHIIERLNRLDEIPQKLSFLFWEDDIFFDEKSFNKVLLKNIDNSIKVLTESINIFNDIQNSWECSELQDLCAKLCDKLNLKPRDVFQPIRVAISGNMVSPPLFESIQLIKREHVISRIKKTINLLNKDNV